MDKEVKIPDKLFYRINEVAAITGVKPYVLRYWESEFPMLSPEKDEKDQRRYRRSDIDLILQIKKLLYEEKYTIAGARQMLKKLRSERGGETKADPGGGHQSANSAAAASEGEQESTSPKRPPMVDPTRVRELNSAIAELRGELTELFRILADKT